MTAVELSLTCTVDGPDADLRVTGDACSRTLVRRSATEVLILHGDLMTPDPVPLPPTGTPVGEIIAQAGGQFFRHCGVLADGLGVTIWTDHGAMRPLFYRPGHEGGWRLATAAAGLVPDGERRLSHGPRREGTTGFVGVASTPAGSTVRLPWRRDERSTSHRWFNLPDPAPTSDAQAVDCVDAALRASVTELLAGRSSAGALLSGGVDSSLVCALAAERLADLRTYTVGTPYGNEFASARQVAAVLGSDHHELELSCDMLERLLPEMVERLETWDLNTLMIAAPGCFALDALAAREDLLLTGYGADLLFAGLGVAAEGCPQQTLRSGVAATAWSNEFSPEFADARGIAVRHPYWTAAVMHTALRFGMDLLVRDGQVKWVLRRAAGRILPRYAAERPKRAIQDGTAMQRLFARILGSDDPAILQRRLQELAEKVFDGGAGEGPREERDRARPLGLAS